jgi:hypothetical protein
MVRMLRAIPAAQPLDIRELIVQRNTMHAAHDADIRPGPDQIAACYLVDESVCAPSPRSVALY